MTFSGKIRRISYLPKYEISHEREYWNFGVPLIFRTNNEILLEAAEEAFGRFPRYNIATKKPLVITLLVTESVNPSTETKEPKFTHCENYFFISLNKDNTAIANIKDGYAYGFLTPDVAKERAYVRYTFIEALSQAMLGPSRNYIHIHAACIRKNGVTLILQGKAGSGKSTLAYACVRTGYQLIAEDVVHASFNHNKIKLWGAPWKFHLLPDATRFFPELENIEPSLQMNGELKLEFEIDDFHPGAAITHAGPGPIILVMRNPDLPASLRRLSEDQGIKEFEILWPWHNGWTAIHDNAAKKLLNHGVYRLSTGNSLSRPLSMLDDLICELSNS